MTTTSKADIWLQRVSHISQFGLFLFTVGAIYFTVIPLYQKALLDEQIARKEIELSRLQKELDSAYVKVRSSVVGSYAARAGAECSGLLLPVDLTVTLRDHPTYIERSHSEELLSIRPADCLSKELSDTDLSELKTDDLVYLQLKIVRISTTLEQRRQAALARFGKAEETAKVGPHNMSNMGLAGEIAKIVLKDEPPEYQQSMLAEIAVGKERSAAAEHYADEVRSELLKLRDMEWPSDAGRDL